MLGTDIGLTHSVAIIRYQELLAEAAHQRKIDDMLAQQGRTRRSGISELRALVANALLRTGSWLMPDETRGHAARGGLELRPGR